MVRNCGSWTSGANNCIVFGEPPHLYTMGARVPAPGEGTKTSAKHFAANRKGLFTGGNVTNWSTFDRKIVPPHK
jgi:hypothetical protein